MKDGRELDDHRSPYRNLIVRSTIRLVMLYIYISERRELGGGVTPFGRISWGHIESKG